MNMIDCASGITQQIASTLDQNGITHVGRYLSSGWKGITLPESQVIKQAGMNIVSIYETNPTQANYFSHDQGVADANSAYKLANALGQPKGTAIYFTVDYDAPISDYASILNYFQGIKDTLKSYKIGVYAKFEVIVLLKTKGLADYFFQTYAWSAGQHAKNIHLFQYKNDINQYGLNLDMDQVENADCGSWGGQVVQPAPAPTPTPHVYKTYRVQSGDTMSSIAQKNGLTLAQIIAYNPNIANPNLISVGQTVNLEEVPPAGITTQKYKIQNGDSLTKIASIFHTSVDRLMQLNPSISNPNKIYAGQIIIIPK